MQDHSSDVDNFISSPEQQRFLEDLQLYHFQNTQNFDVNAFDRQTAENYQVQGILTNIKKDLKSNVLYN